MKNRTLSSGRAALRACACSIPLILSPFASAQDDEKVIELSPFQVDVSGDEGWRASTTLIGNRTNQELKNVPLTVDALTTEFMQDVGVYTLEDAAFYVAGLDAVNNDERVNDDGAMAFRGLSLGGRENAASSRNFFMWYPRSDNYNVSRIDFNKGSNSLMFGDASPGGQATVYTKRAQFRNFGEVTAQYGSYDSNRFMLDVNRMVNDKLAFRVNAVDRSERSYLDFANDWLRGYDLAATYKPFEHTTLRIEVEDLKYRRTRALSDLFVNQRAARGLGFTSSDQVFTSDGDLVDGRYDPDRDGKGVTRAIYKSDGKGGFLAPYVLPSVDRSGGATGDDLDLAYPFAPSVAYNSAALGDPLTADEIILTFDPISKEVNTAGPRDFLDRDINAYTIWLEQSFGDLNIELSANRQEQFQFRNDSHFGQTINVSGSGRMYLESSLDQKWFGNDVNIVRASASYPLKLGENITQYLVASFDYLDDEAFSFRERLVNKAAAYDASTGTYDPTVDLEGRHRIRVRGWFAEGDPAADLRNFEQWSSLRPENLPVIKGVLEPMWVAYTTANKPYTDMRYSKSGSFSASGSYFDGKLRSLLGVRRDEFALKRYILPSGSRAELVDQYGEIAYWGQDVFVGSPDDAPEYYEYVPDLDQSATTASYGLVYRLNDAINVYGNASESFRWQGTEDFLGRILGPQTGETKEIGFKGDLMNGQFSATFAAFEIDRGNVAYQLGDENNQTEIERLFNDTLITIDPDGTLIYHDPDPASPGYVETGRGLNQEHRQVTAQENVKGYELTLMMRRTAGLQARVALSHIDIKSIRDLAEYASYVDLAAARVPVRQAFLDQHWPSDPNYKPGTLPTAEKNLRDSLAYAQRQVEINSGDGLIEGTRARPYTASWVLDYQCSDNFVLPGMRVLLTGRYEDNYLMSTNDELEWYGGSTHTVNLSFIHKTEMFGNPARVQLRVSDLIDFENKDYKEFGGFVDEFSGEPTIRHRRIRPPRFDVTWSMEF